MEDKKTTRNFRNYKVWQDASELSAYVYQVTDKMPWFEQKALCDQLRRAVVSISSNIAEGSARPTVDDFAHFLDMSLGSSYEVESQLHIALLVGYVEQEIHDDILKRVQSVESQLTALIRKLRE